MARDKDRDKDKDQHHESEEPVIRDKRRIDPETGDVRQPEQSQSDPIDEELHQLLEEAEREEREAASGAATASASEHLEDLKRLQAEFVNYRKRVERDRSLARELAIADVLTELLAVLDDLDLADAHGDLEEGSPLELVAQKFRNTLQRMGLERIDPAGEVFDPTEHEAIARVPSDDDEGLVIDVVQIGYRIGERLLRPAKVAVSAPKE